MSRSVARLSLPRLSGAIVTVAAVIVLELVARAGIALPSAAPLLLLGVAGSAFVGGVVGGMTGVVIAAGYLVYLYSDSTAVFRLSSSDQFRLALIVISGTGIALLAGLLKRRSDEIVDNDRLKLVNTSAELEQARELHQAVIDSLPSHVAVLDGRGRIIAVNRAWETFGRENAAGQSASPGLGANYLDVCHGAVGAEVGDARRVAAGIKSVLAGECERFTFEYPCHSPTEQRWFLLSVTPLAHRHQGAVVTHISISPRKLAEQELSRMFRRLELQQLRLQGLLANVPAIVWEVYADPQRQSENFVSRYLEQMLGYPVKQWLADDQFWLSIIHPEDRDGARRQLDELLSSGNATSLVYRCISADNRTVWVETRAVSIIDDTQQIIGFRCVTLDISQHKRAQRALRRRADQLIRLARRLKKSNEDLDQFAYITSHDLRAPLRGIANLSRWIEEDLGDRFTPEAHQQMEMLRGRVHRMEALINGILQYSRVGRVKIRPERVDIEQLIRECIDLLGPPAQFVFDIGPDMPVIVGQKLRLQQVIMNLISNAIKHHDRPGGRLRISARDLGELYEFSFSDNGPGIAPAYHEKIFQLFQTLRPRDQVEATGVGLSLVKRIVESQGGSVQVESQEGHGATFRFTWPKNVIGA
jgi:PAS domain S-box-containing protein